MPILTPADLGAARWWRSTEGLFAEGMTGMEGVASWTDRIAGAVLAQTDMLTRPQLVPASGAGAGWPALNFLGNGMTWLSLPAASMPTLTQPYTIGVVAMTREGGRSQTLTKTLGTGGGSAGELGVAPDAAPARWRLFAGGTYNGSTNPAVLGNRTAVLGRFDGSASQLVSNGRRMANGAAGVRRADGILHVGWDPATASNGNRAWNGLLWELVLWNRALSDDDVAAFDTYAQDRYGIAVADYSRPVRAVSASSALSRVVAPRARLARPTSAAAARSSVVAPRARLTRPRSAVTTTARALAVHVRPATPTSRTTSTAAARARGARAVAARAAATTLSAARARGARAALARAAATTRSSVRTTSTRTARARAAVEALSSARVTAVRQRVTYAVSALAAASSTTTRRVTTTRAASRHLAASPVRTSRTAPTRPRAATTTTSAPTARHGAATRARSALQARAATTTARRAQARPQGAATASTGATRATRSPVLARVTSAATAATSTAATVARRALAVGWAVAASRVRGAHAGEAPPLPPDSGLDTVLRLGPVERAARVGAARRLRTVDTVQRGRRFGVPRR